MHDTLPLPPTAPPHQTLRVGSPKSWARDFALLGLATGSAAPFFVVFDPIFAVTGGIAAAATGALVGAASAHAVERARGHVPLAVLVPGMAVVGALWGALTGTFAGATSAVLGTSLFDGAALPLGFILGGCVGMVQLALFFPAYLALSVRRQPIWPLMLAVALFAPVMGWLGLAALVASLFGLWLFVLPFAAWAAVGIDRSERSERARWPRAVQTSMEAAHPRSVGAPSAQRLRSAHHG